MFPRSPDSERQVHNQSDCWRGKRQTLANQSARRQITTYLTYSSPSTLQRVRSTREQHTKQTETSTVSTQLCVSPVQKLRNGKITFSHPELTKLPYLNWKLVTAASTT
jgi:hypothetical protein